MADSDDSADHDSPPASGFDADLLAGQVALVTGGATGIGREIARVLGAHGAAVTLASRHEGRLTATVSELRSAGIDADYGVCDVRDAGAVGTVVDGVISRHGRLDIVVNNAAGNFPAPMSAISPNGFKGIVDIDLLGTYNATRATFDRWLRDHGGSIVNITAPFAQRGVTLRPTWPRPRPASIR
jgi:NAD(P)-dependent dehydrogenase (short-subunit alcohol dehydrogenase family)